MPERPKEIKQLRKKNLPNKLKWFYNNVYLCMSVRQFQRKISRVGRVFLISHKDPSITQKYINI